MTAGCLAAGSFYHFGNRIDTNDLAMRSDGIHKAQRWFAGPSGYIDNGLTRGNVCIGNEGLGDGAEHYPVNSPVFFPARGRLAELTNDVVVFGHTVEQSAISTQQFVIESLKFQILNPRISNLHYKLLIANC